jgi:hypothetical protein
MHQPTANFDGCGAIKVLDRPETIPPGNRCTVRPSIWLQIDAARQCGVDVCQLPI